MKKMQISNGTFYTAVNEFDEMELGCYRRVLIVSELVVNGTQYSTVQSAYFDIL